VDSLIRKTLRACAFALGLAFFAGSAQPQCLLEETFKLPMPADELTGYALAIDGRWALASSTQQGGRIHVFRRDQGRWQEVQTLPGGGIDDNLAILGDTLLVGDPFSDRAAFQAGAVRVYLQDGGSWTNEAQLTASDATEMAYFGDSVVLAPDLAIVGAPLDSRQGYEVGAAYVFRRSGTAWIQEQILRPPVATASSHFGIDVVAHSNRILVGASGDQQLGLAAGTVYVYVHNGTDWIEEAQLRPTDGRAYLSFGRAMDFDGSRALVGALGDDTLGIQSGAAYLFHRNGSFWSQEEKLVAADGAANDIFGAAVCLEGDLALVGAPWHLEMGVRGTVYEYRRGTHWQLARMLQASDGRDPATFGHCLALQDGLLLAGSTFAVEGDVYVFENLDEAVPLTLDTSHRQVCGGQSVQLQTRGPALASAFLTLEAVNGTPVFSVLASDTLDSSGQWSYRQIVPTTPSLAGHQFSLRSFVGCRRALAPTNEVHITVH
jgi:hypothetical protein